MPGLKCSRPTIFQTAGLILTQNRLCRPGIKGRSTDSHAQGFTGPFATALLARTQKSLMTMRQRAIKKNRIQVTKED